MMAFTSLFVFTFTDEYGNDDSGSGSSSQGIILMSLGILLCAVLVIALCAGGFRECWPTRYVRYCFKYV